MAEAVRPTIRGDFPAQLWLGGVARQTPRYLMIAASDFSVRDRYNLIWKTNSFGFSVS